MESKDNPIYRWLSTVEQEQSHRQGEGMALSRGCQIFRANRAPGNKQREMSHEESATSISCIPLDISDVIGRGHSNTRKRDASCLEESGAPSTHETILGSESHKRSRNTYELRPRHKTREDRYEYKGPSSALGSQSQPRKGRTKKRACRKHTMNDEFQATNVTGSRLTLRNNTKLGIFSKGRTSSSSNHHKDISSANLTKATPSLKSRRYSAESDLAFSEMAFLPRRNNPSPDPTWTHKDDHGGRHDGDCDQQELLLKDSLDNCPKLAMTRPGNNWLGGKRKRVISEEAPLHEISSASPRLGNVSPNSPNKRRRTSQSPSIPYTWSESDTDSIAQGNALEQYLLNLMHVGMDLQTLCTEISNPGLTKQYWSLSELWVLLCERKASWPSEIRNETRTSPGTNTDQHATGRITPQVQPEMIELTHLHSPGADSMNNGISQQFLEPYTSIETPSGVNRCLPEQDTLPERGKYPKKNQDSGQSDNGLPQNLDRKSCFNVPTHAPTLSDSQTRSTDLLNEDRYELFSPKKADKETISPAILSEVRQPPASDIEFYDLSQVDDDEVFYHTLDAAYHAIVHPEVAAEVASDLQELLASPGMTVNPYSEVRLLDPKDRGRQARATRNGPPKHQTKKEDARPSEPFLEENFPMHHLNGVSFDGSNDLPWLDTGHRQPQLCSTTGIIARRSQPPGLCEFWRQNRLY
ncbi:hypothetical protein N7457_005711 [Penicillium paradoxum]|uniref:uncharacterized protein n=1 Tax=Penicillium paradoxum TaxID=176176 RepID=UPI0025467D6B|nr:uncharacterized protein N7457_005711 [Penicillium paradoxum]KAJ5780551.1 hypothetical protein N7457_005711 [Penicillium paradoxum]